MKKVDYLIIGNGITGFTAAKQIRSKDSDSSIIIVGNEPYHTYYRVKLTELLSKDFQEEDIYLCKENWYEENNIEVILRKIVEKLDTENKVVTLDDSVEIQFDKLLLATGSRPFIPPITGNYKKGFFALRNLKDLYYIKSYLTNKDKVAVIGGGLLGLEAAWALKELGKEVSIIEFADNLLSRQLDEELSKVLEEELLNRGFKLYLSSAAEEIIGDNDIASGIKLSTGKIIDVDAVLVSSGVRSDLDLVRETDIKTNRGIVVDSKLETNIEGIYAAGDVAEINGMTLGLWTAGLEMGRIVGDNMLGENSEYKIPKLFASLNIGDIKLFSAGETSGVDKVIRRENEEGISKLFINNNKIVGAILYGDTRAMGKYRKAVFDKLEVDKFLEENDLKGEYK